MKSLTNPTTQQPGYRNFKEENDKPFYSAYLNTAKQNVFIVLRDISEKLGLAFDSKNDHKLIDKDKLSKHGYPEMWDRLKLNDKPDVSQRIIDRLEHQFTFASQLAINQARNRANTTEVEPTPEDYYEVFKLWIKQLLNYRNYYTHAVHIPVQMNPAIVDGMRDLYDADWKKFKERKALSLEDSNHLIRLGKMAKGKNLNMALRINPG